MSLHAGSYTRPDLATDLIVVEPEQSLSRQTVLLLGKTATRDVTIGTVLAESAPGIYTEVDFAATDGTETAVAVAVVNRRVPANTNTPSVVIDALAVLRDAQLVWPTGATSTQIAGALASLKTALIKTR